MRKFTRIFISILAAATVISGTASAIALETVETIADVVPTTAAFPEAALTADVLDGTFESEQDLDSFITFEDVDGSPCGSYNLNSSALGVTVNTEYKGIILKNIGKPGDGAFQVSFDVVSDSNFTLLTHLCDEARTTNLSANYKNTALTANQKATISNVFSADSISGWNKDSLSLWLQVDTANVTFTIDNIKVIPTAYDGTFEGLLPDKIVNGGVSEVVEKDGNRVLKVTSGNNLKVSVPNYNNEESFCVSFDIIADSAPVTIDVFLYDGSSQATGDGNHLKKYVTSKTIAANTTETISYDFSKSDLEKNASFDFTLNALQLWYQTTSDGIFYLDNIKATPIVYNYDGTFEDRLPAGVVTGGTTSIEDSTNETKALKVSLSGYGVCSVNTYGQLGTDDFEVSFDIMSESDVNMQPILSDGTNYLNSSTNLYVGGGIVALKANEWKHVSGNYSVSDLSTFNLDNLKIAFQPQAEATFWVDNIKVEPVGFDGTFEQVLPSDIIYADANGSYERVPCGDGTYALKVVRTAADGTFQVKNIGKPSADKDRFVVTFDIGADTEAVTIKAFLYDEKNITNPQYATIELQPGEKQTVAHVFSKADLANWNTDNLILWFQTTEANKTFYLDNILVADYGISTDFEMLNLFQIRENAPSGLRFVSLINCTTADTADSYGFVIARKSQLGDTKLTLTTTDENSDILTIVGRAKEAKDGNQIVYDATGASIDKVVASTNKAITAVITNITDNRKDEVFVVRPFFELDGIAYYGNPVEQSYNGATKNN